MFEGHPIYAYAENQFHTQWIFTMSVKVWNMEQLRHLRDNTIEISECGKRAFEVNVISPLSLDWAMWDEIFWTEGMYIE